MKITEEKAKEIGFEEVNAYEHDEWKTVVYEKGYLRLEFTYEIQTWKLDSMSLDIEEMSLVDLDVKTIEKLDEILND